MYRDRRQAGRRLAQALLQAPPADPVVLALARGGVPVGFEVAAALRAPFDVLVVRKLGAPGRPELGVGALVDPGEPEVLLDRALLARLGLREADLAGTVAREREELLRRERVYRGDRPGVPLRGRGLIVVDDGVATGVSMRAALRSLARREPAELVLAVPVAAPRALDALAGEVDRVVCPLRPRDFRAVGEHYADFRPTSDAEVCALLARASGFGAADAAARADDEELHLE